MLGIQLAQVEASTLAVEAADEDAAAEKVLYGPARGYSGKCRDDLTGQPS